LARTIVDLPPALLRDADALCLCLGVSRAELVRRALQQFLQGQPQLSVDGFGLWLTAAGQTEAEPTPRPRAAHARARARRAVALKG